MANTIEIILKAIDKASDIIRGVEQKTTASNEAMAKSFEGVGIASDAVDNKLKSYGAALDDVSRAQNQLKQAQFEAQEAAQKLAQAQYNLAQNTDPAKIEGLNKALIDAQVQLDRAGKEVQDLSAQMRNSGEAASSGAQGFESFAGKLVAIQAGIGIAKEALAGLKQVWDFAKEGAENQRIAQSFSRTAESIGANADDIIKKLDEAAKGTVDDEELMQASTRALTLGVAKSGADLVNVMKLARGAALQFGGDAGQAFEAINQAIGNLAPRALKQFGIIVNLGEANKKYADSIGVTVDALTEEQQRQALLNEVLAQGAKNFGDIGNAAATTAEKMKALETRAANYLDIAKEIAANGISTALDITDAPKNAMAAFVDTAQKMRTAVADGKMTVEEYNAGLKDMAQTIRPLVTGALAEAAYNSYKLDASFAASTKGAYGLSGALDETARAARRSADAQAAEAARQDQAKDAAQKHTQVMRAYADQLLKNVAAYERTKINLADTTSLAIQYTEAQQKQQEVQAKLDELNKTIEARGPARTALIKNEKLSTEDLARAKAGLAAAQEDLTTVQKKSGETDAEFALRVETIKSKIAEYSQKLGEHTAIVGGATKAELEQKTALEAQIATLQKADEIDRAKSAFEALTAAFRDGALTEAQYTERAAALNEITHLYSASALETATRQETLMKSFADSRSEDWRSQLIRNKEAIDGVVDATGKAIDATDRLKNAQGEAAKAPPVARGETKAEKIEVPTADKATEAAQAALDFINRSKTESNAAKKAIEDVSAADERASREMKGRLDEVPESYGAIGRAIEDTRARNASMTADAIKAAQDRSTAQEAESREMKGRITEVAGAYNQIPTEVTTTIRTVFPEAQGVAGDSIAERAEQLRKMQNTTVKTKVEADTTDATKKINTYLPLVSKVPAEKKTLAIADTLAATYKINDWIRLLGVIPTGVETLIEVAGTALLDLNNILQAEDNLHDKTIVVNVKTNRIGGPQEGFAQGVDMIVPPSPTGKAGDYFPFLAAAGERVTVTPAGKQAPSGMSIGAVNITVGGSNATPDDIYQAVYKGIEDVFNEARA